MHKFLSSFLLFTSFAFTIVVGGWMWQDTRAQQPRSSVRHPVLGKQPNTNRHTPKPLSQRSQQKYAHSIKTAASPILLIHRILKWVKKKNNNHPDRHFSKLQALLQQPVPGVELVKAIRSSLHHKNWRIRQKATYVLSRASTLFHDKALSKQLRTMARKDRHWMVRVEAIRALGTVSNSYKKKVQKTLLQSLEHDKYWQVRAQAARTLGQMGEGPVPKHPTLQEALNDTSWQVRTAMATTLLQVVPLSKTLLQALGQRLSDPEPAVQHATAYTLGRIGSHAIPVLVQATQSKQLRTRQQAFLALACYGQGSTKAMTTLRHALRDKDWRVAQSAAEALSQIGSKAAPAIPELTLLLQHAKPALRLMASWTLQKVGVAALPKLRQLLHNPKPFVKIIAAETIGLLGPAAASVAPSLVDTLLDKSWHVRREAAWALYRMGPAIGAHIPMGMIPVLINTLQDKQWSVRYGVAHTLGWMGPRSRMVIGWFGQRTVSTSGALRKLIKHDPKPRVRHAAQQALYRVMFKTY